MKDWNFANAKSLEIRFRKNKPSILYRGCFFEEGKTPDLLHPIVDEDIAVLCQIFRYFLTI